MRKRVSSFTLIPSERKPCGADGHESLSELENPAIALETKAVKVAEPSLDEALSRVAQKPFWWKTPTEALQDRLRFVAQVMTYGTWDDVQTTRGILGEETFRAVLKNPPAGVFDAPSWVYWHNVFGIQPIPELPKRKLP